MTRSSALLFASANTSGLTLLFIRSILWIYSYSCLSLLYLFETLDFHGIEYKWIIKYGDI
jgi:hypothetical protein